ncbi:hypothetical protein MAR_037266, partial [Mya arenaria]
QSQVTCYPHRKLSEFSERIEQLTREYRSYLRKYRELEPGEQHTPWTDKPYSRKQKYADFTHICTDASDTPSKKSRDEFSPLATPVLDVEEADYSYTQLEGLHTHTSHTVPLPVVNLETQDKPLDFNPLLQHNGNYLPLAFERQEQDS